MMRNGQLWAIAAAACILLGGAAAARASNVYRDLVISDDPVAYWRLDQNSTAAIAVNSATGGSSAGALADGAYSAGVVLNQPSLLRSGEGSSMQVLNTTLDRMTSAAFEKFAGGSGFSVEFWVQFQTAPTGLQNIVGDGESAGDFDLMVYRVAGAGIRPHVNTTLGTSAINPAGQPFTETVDAIHHVVSTWDASTGVLSAYVDGRLQSTTVVNAGTALNTNNPIFIGRDNRESPNRSTLTVDEAAVYNKPLTTAQVRDHFNRGNFGDLIGEFDYTDTFTDTVFGGIAGRVTNGTFPVSAAGRIVEDNYGNPNMVWTSGKWSLNRDAVTSGTAPKNPHGSVGGFTQTGGGNDWGIEYGLRNHYIVQFDAVQANDRIDITSASVRDQIASVANNGLSVFFRGDNYVGPNGFVGLYNGSVETNTGFGPFGVLIGEWATYAVRFNQLEDIIEVFVNGQSLGIIDLTTFAGGIHAGFSNAAVSVGGTGFASNAGSRMWTDNFAVGAAVPAPAALPAGLALMALAATRRRRR